MNPDNPVTRLRAQLSTPGRMMTRQDLADLTGIPLGSLAAIETKVYKLTRAAALKLAYATEVDLESLLRGDDPLLDRIGESLSPWSMKTRHYTDRDKQNDEKLLSSLLERAAKKKCGVQVSIALRMWIKETAIAFKLPVPMVEVAPDPFRKIADFKSPFPPPKH